MKFWKHRFRMKRDELLLHPTLFYICMFITTGCRTSTAQTLISEQPCNGCCETRAQGHVVILATVIEEDVCKKSTRSNDTYSTSLSSSSSSAIPVLSSNGTLIKYTSLSAQGISNTGLTSFSTSSASLSNITSGSSTEQTSISAQPDGSSAISEVVSSTNLSSTFSSHTDSRSSTKNTYISSRSENYVYTIPVTSTNTQNTPSIGFSRITVTAPSFSYVPTFDVTTPTIFTQTDILPTSEYSRNNPYQSTMIQETFPVDSTESGVTQMNSILTTYTKSNLFHEINTKNTLEMFSSIKSSLSTTDSKERISLSMTTPFYSSTQFDSKHFTSKMTLSDDVNETTKIELTTKSFLFSKSSTKISIHSMSTRLRQIQTQFSTNAINHEHFLSTTDKTITTELPHDKTDIFLPTHTQDKLFSDELSTSSLMVHSFGTTLISSTDNKRIIDKTLSITQEPSLISTDYKLLPKTEETSAKLLNITSNIETEVPKLSTPATKFSSIYTTDTLQPTALQNVNNEIFPSVMYMSSTIKVSDGSKSTDEQVERKEITSHATRTPLHSTTTTNVPPTTLHSETIDLFLFKTPIPTSTLSICTENYPSTRLRNIMLSTTDISLMTKTLESDVSVDQSKTNFASFTPITHLLSLSTEHDASTTVQVTQLPLLASNISVSGSFPDSVSFTTVQSFTTYLSHLTTYKYSFPTNSDSNPSTAAQRERTNLPIVTSISLFGTTSETDQFTTISSKISDFPSFKTSDVWSSTSIIEQKEIANSTSLTTDIPLPNSSTGRELTTAIHKGISYLPSLKTHIPSLDISTNSGAFTVKQSDRTDLSTETTNYFSIDTTVDEFSPTIHGELTGVPHFTSNFPSFGTITDRYPSTTKQGDEYTDVPILTTDIPLLNKTSHSTLSSSVRSEMTSSFATSFSSIVTTEDGNQSTKIQYKITNITSFETTTASDMYSEVQSKSTNFYSSMPNFSKYVTVTYSYSSTTELGKVMKSPAFTDIIPSFQTTADFDLSTKTHGKTNLPKITSNIPLFGTTESNQSTKLNEITELLSTKPGAITMSPSFMTNNVMFDRTTDTYSSTKIQDEITDFAKPTTKTLKFGTTTESGLSTILHKDKTVLLTITSGISSFETTTNNYHYSTTRDKTVHLSTSILNIPAINQTTENDRISTIYDNITDLLTTNNILFETSLKSDLSTTNDVKITDTPTSSTNIPSETITDKASFTTMLSKMTDLNTMNIHSFEITTNSGPSKTIQAEKATLPILATSMPLFRTTTDSDLSTTKHGEIKNMLTTNILSFSRTTEYDQFTTVDGDTADLQTFSTGTPFFNATSERQLSTSILYEITEMPKFTENISWFNTSIVIDSSTSLLSEITELPKSTVNISSPGTTTYYESSSTIQDENTYLPTFTTITSSFGTTTDHERLTTIQSKIIDISTFTTKIPLSVTETDGDQSSTPYIEITDVQTFTTNIPSFGIITSSDLSSPVHDETTESLSFTMNIHSFGTTTEHGSFTAIHDSIADISTTATKIPFHGKTTKILNEIIDFITTKNLSLETSKNSYLSTTKQEDITDIITFTSIIPSFGTNLKKNLSTTKQEEIATMPILKTVIPSLLTTTQDKETKLPIFTSLGASHGTLTDSDLYTTKHGAKTNIQTYATYIPSFAMTSGSDSSTVRRDLSKSFVSSRRPTDVDQTTTFDGEKEDLAIFTTYIPSFETDTNRHPSTAIRYKITDLSKFTTNINLLKTTTYNDPSN